jgi:hypothetical protein
MKVVPAFTPQKFTEASACFDSPCALECPLSTPDLLARGCFVLQRHLPCLLCLFAFERHVMIKEL